MILPTQVCDEERSETLDEPARKGKSAPGRHSRRREVLDEGQGGSV